MHQVKIFIIYLDGTFNPDLGKIAPAPRQYGYTVLMYEGIYSTHTKCLFTTNYRFHIWSTTKGKQSASDRYSN